jgi:hypothetical protein
MGVLFILMAGTEAGLIYRAIALGDQEAAFALATGYQLTNYSGSALVYLLQKGLQIIAQEYYAYQYFKVINRALDISKMMYGKTPEELSELLIKNK